MSGGASERAPSLRNAFGMHPHSGIATLTYLLEGDTLYEDTTGEQGVLVAGGVERMRGGPATGCGTREGLRPP